MVENVSMFGNHHDWDLLHGNWCVVYLLHDRSDIQAGIVIKEGMANRYVW